MKYLLALMFLVGCTQVVDQQGRPVIKPEEHCIGGHTYYGNPWYKGWAAIKLDDDGKPVKCGNE